VVGIDGRDNAKVRVMFDVVGVSGEPCIPFCAGTCAVGKSRPLISNQS
jgi:hypothetical protein